MYWVKLTNTDGKTVFVNLDKFDQISTYTDESNNEVTCIKATLSETDDDHIEIDVIEAPEKFIG